MKPPTRYRLSDAEKDALLLEQAAPIASDETTTRVNGVTHWHWVFISDRYAGQQDLGANHQVCLAHVLRDVQYAIDCGDTVVAPKIRDLLRWTIGIGKRRPELKDNTVAAYAAKAERKLDALVGTPAAHPAGKILQRQIKAWRTKFFVFLTDRDVPPTNNISEREIRPSVVFRKVTGGFRSVTGTARLKGVTALEAIRSLIDGTWVVA